MKIVNKIFCIFLVISVIVSLTVTVCSAYSYTYDDDAEYYVESGLFVGSPFTVTANCGYGYFSTINDFGLTPYPKDLTDYYGLSSFTNAFIGDNSYLLDYVRNILYVNQNYFIEDLNRYYVASDAYFVSNYIRESYLLNRNFNDIIADLPYIELINFPQRLSGGGVPVFTYDGVISTDFLSGDGYIGNLPSKLSYTLLVDDDYVDADGTSLDLSGNNNFLANQEFEFVVSCDFISIDDNYNVVYTPYSHAWTATNNHSTDYVRANLTTDSFCKAIASNYSNQGAGVSCVDFVFNLRRIYHTLSHNTAGQYITNIKFYITPTDYNVYGYGSPLFDNSFIESFSFLNSPTPILRFGFDSNSVTSGPISYEYLEGNYKNWLVDSGERVINKEYVSLNDFSLIDWLGDTLGDVMDINIIGSISLSDVILLFAGLGMLAFILKMFLGG